MPVASNVNLPSNLPNIDPPALFDIDLLTPLKNFLNWLVTQVVNLGQTIASFLNERVIKPIIEGFNWIITKIIEGIKDFFNKIINFIKGSASPITPEKALEIGLGVLAIAGLGALTIGALLTALNIKVVGCGIDVEPFTKFCSKLFDVRIIVSVTLGALLYTSLRVPIEYWGKKIFRPFKPDPITLFGLYTRGYITREQLKSELAYVTGFSDVYIDGLIDIFEYNPSLFDLLRMADFVELSDDFIDRSLKVLGIKKPYLDVIKTLIKRRPIREEIRANVNFLIYLYQNGYISKEFLEKALDGLKLQSSEKELILMLADNKRTYELIERKIKILRTSFIKGFINEATLVSELEKLKLDKEFINIIVQDAKLYAKVELPVPKVKRTFSTDLTLETKYTALATTLELVRLRPIRSVEFSYSTRPA